jgi:hypothetical protein
MFVNFTVNCCENKVQDLVNNNKFAEAFDEYFRCFDRADYEQVFTLAVLYMNSAENKALLDKKYNIQILNLLKKSLLDGHIKSRLLLSEIYGSGLYNGIPKDESLSKCLGRESEKIDFYLNCFKVEN